MTSSSVLSSESERKKAWLIYGKHNKSNRPNFLIKAWPSHHVMYMAVQSKYRISMADVLRV